MMESGLNVKTHYAMFWTVTNYGIAHTEMWKWTCIIWALILEFKKMGN